MKKLWNRDSDMDREVFDFTVGRDWEIDQELLPYDIMGSKAHARMLEKIGILNKREAKDIHSVLDDLEKDYEKGKVKIPKEDEDMHTLIEHHLVKKLGDAGKKIHTGRSRNDQVLTAIRLYSRDVINQALSECLGIIKSLNKFQKRHGKIEMAGYTHMRKAMPTTVSDWSQAYIESMEDNISLLEFIRDHTDQSPLGTGAGYGVPLELDRKFTAKELGFKKIQDSPIYTQNSRGKFESLVLEALIQVMHDLNRMASDLILLSMPEFGIFRLPAKFTTGSSIMPQKKNPDVLELVRGKYHIVLGEKHKLEGLTANLIMGYNRDTQLAKEAFVNGTKVALETIHVMTVLLPELEVDKERAKESLTEELYATQKVYDLVKRGKSFREAYHEVKEGLGK